METVTLNSAVVSWEGDADNYEVAYRIVDEEWISEEVMGAHTFTLENLTPLTNYQVRVRSVCSEDDISVWSEIKTFTTLDNPPQPPPCDIPVNLNVTEKTTTSALLSWEEGNEENLNWDLRYKEASASSWNDVEALEVKTYVLEELTPFTVYVWTVRANCSEDQTSDWAAQNEFTTEPVGINDVKKEQMTVYSSGKMLNIINPGKRFIERVELFGISGSLLGEYAVNSTDNVLIPTALPEMVAIVKVTGKNEVETYKVLVK
jgi:chitodextrinase